MAQPGTNVHVGIPECFQPDAEGNTVKLKLLVSILLQNAKDRRSERIEAGLEARNHQYGVNEKGYSTGYYNIGNMTYNAWRQKECRDIEKKIKKGMEKGHLYSGKPNERQFEDHKDAYDRDETGYEHPPVEEGGKPFWVPKLPLILTKYLARCAKNE